MPAPDAETFVYERPLANYFEAAAAGAKKPKPVANWVINNLRAKLTETQTPLEQVKIKAADIPEVIDDDGTKVRVAKRSGEVIS